jgi:hypothetical protein
MGLEDRERSAHDLMAVLSTNNLQELRKPTKYLCGFKRYPGQGQSSHFIQVKALQLGQFAHCFNTERITRVRRN